MKPTAFVLAFSSPPCPSAPTESPNRGAPCPPHGRRTRGRRRRRRARAAARHTPAGYTSRCLCLFGLGPQMTRRVTATGFVPSSGVQIRPTIKVVLISNGDDMVLTKTAACPHGTACPKRLPNGCPRRQDRPDRPRHTPETTTIPLRHRVWPRGAYLGNDQFLPENHAAFVEQASRLRSTRMPTFNWPRWASAGRRLGSREPGLQRSARREQRPHGVCR